MYTALYGVLRINVDDSPSGSCAVTRMVPATAMSTCSVFLWLCFPRIIPDGVLYVQNTRLIGNGKPEEFSTAERYPIFEAPCLGIVNAYGLPACFIAMCFLIIFPHYSIRIFRILLYIPNSCLQISGRDQLKIKELRLFPVEAGYNGKDAGSYSLFSGSKFFFTSSSCFCSLRSSSWITRQTSENLTVA